MILYCTATRDFVLGDDDKRVLVELDVAAIFAWLR